MNQQKLLRLAEALMAGKSRRLTRADMRQLEDAGFFVMTEQLPSEPRTYWLVPRYFKVFQDSRAEDSSVNARILKQNQDALAKLRKRAAASEMTP